MVDVRAPLAVAVVGLAAVAVPQYSELPLAQWLPDVIVGAVAVALAMVSWRASRALSGQALFVAMAWWAGTSWPFALYWHRGALIYLILSAPRPWPRSRIAAAAVGAGFLAAAITPAWQVPAAATGLCALVILAAAVETRAHHNRRIVPTALLFCLAIAGGVLAPVIDGEVGPLVALIGYDVLVLVILLLERVYARVPTRSALTDLAVDLGRTPVRSVDTIAELVRADPGLALDREIHAALDVAQRLEEGNTRIRDELRAAVGQVEQSRRRLVVAAAAERSRLAEELRESAAEPLRALAESAPVNGSARLRLDRAVEALDAAVSGLRPPGLSDGITHALREHSLVASLGVELQMAEDRCDEVVEDTLYAVAVEGLANVAKHAGPCAVTAAFSVAGGIATLTVSDDGRGGAAIGVGSGLAGLADRVEALGGTLVVRSGAGSGTTLTASVPRALSAIVQRHPSGGGTQAERQSAAPPWLT